MEIGTRVFVGSNNEPATVITWEPHDSLVRFDDESKGWRSGGRGGYWYETHDRIRQAGALLDESPETMEA